MNNLEILENLGVYTVDELGSIRLPHKIRERFGWNEGGTLAMYYLDEDTLLLKRGSDGAPLCVFFRDLGPARND